MSEAAVRFEGVTKSFGGRRVLDDVSFEIPRATAFCLLGRSGTGKSVTLRHIIGLMQPDSGRVFVEEEDVATLDSRALSRVRQGMGFLFQHAALFDSLTVGENVAFPLAPASASLVRHRCAPHRARQAGTSGTGSRLRQDAWRPVGRNAQASGAGARDGAQSADAARRRTQCRPRSHYRRRNRSAAGGVEAPGGHDARRRDAYIPSARAIGDELALLAEGKIVARGTPAALDRSPDPLVRAFMRSEGSG